LGIAVFCMDVSLCLIVRREDGKIRHVLLAMKKRGFGRGWWNGSGGKIEKNETVEQCAVRETGEEIGLTISESHLKKAGVIDFFFPSNPEWDQRMHVYLVGSWQGEPAETEEMRPKWFRTEEVPYNEMWPTDAYWLPQVLEGKMVTGSFTIGEDYQIFKNRIKEVKSLE